jgi:hypothetical protein
MQRFLLGRLSVLTRLGELITSGWPVTPAYRREVLPISSVSSWLLLHGESGPASQHGFDSPVTFLKKNSSWTSFVDDVKRCFRGSAETAEAGCGDHLANTLFAGLRAQAQRNFL